MNILNRFKYPCNFDIDNIIHYHCDIFRKSIEVDSNFSFDDIIDRFEMQFIVSDINRQYKRGDDFIIKSGEKLFILHKSCISYIECNKSHNAYKIEISGITSSEYSFLSSFHFEYVNKIRESRNEHLKKFNR